MTQAMCFPLLVGILFGALWNAVSLWCLSRLLRAWLGPGPSRRRAIGWLMVKFPALYVAIYLALRHQAVTPLGFGIGFSLVLAGALVLLAVRARQGITSRP